jgi:hypothetical protein
MRLLNPLMRIVLRSPLGRRIKGVAVLDFTGRTSGRRYSVPVGWHEANGGGSLVFTPATWRANFAGGRAVSVRHAGTTRAMSGTLSADPAVVTVALQELLDSGASARSFALRMPRGHRLEASDVAGVDRALIRFTTTPGRPA